MNKIKFDLDTARWIADKAQNDTSVFPVEFATCEKCGAAYLPKIGHNCRSVVDIEFHDEIEVQDD